MKYLLPVLAILTTATPIAIAEEPLKVLYLTGGGYHDYEGQRTVIETGLPARLNINIETAMVEGGIKAAELHPKTAEPEWYKGYDAILYNICNCGDSKDKKITDALVVAQKEGKTPAVLMHCTMHCQRFEESGEFPKLLGITSTHHEQHAPVTVTNIHPGHPVMKNFPTKWELAKEELYRVLDTQPEAVPLAVGISGEEKPHTVIWSHTYNGVPVIGTTLGHFTETVANDVFLDLISRSLLHVTGHLNEDGSAAEGYAPAPTPAEPTDQ